MSEAAHESVDVRAPLLTYANVLTYADICWQRVSEAAQASVDAVAPLLMYAVLLAEAAGVYAHVG